MLVHRPNAIEEAAPDLSTASIADLQPAKGLGAVMSQEFTRCLTSNESERPASEVMLLGLGCYWAILDEAHITVLAVDPRYQRRGLGQWLLLNLLLSACGCRNLVPADHRALTRATLEVRPSNSRALALYESFGFETLGRRRRYYADGEDALILWQNSLKTADFRDQLRQRRITASRRLERQGWQLTPTKFSIDRT
ncbi:GNAT family N-acetyltransferase [Nodosilinea sp. LEGE 07088]|nr:GNAT family N-acetyltransferase [Nodosilinea sp. LEGE 07088]